jgi:SAM-dependent methyltransferase
VAESDVDLDPLKGHYRKQLAEHRDTARSVSWGTVDVANRNFAAIAQVFTHETKPFTVYEIGCGVGAMADFLSSNVPLAHYRGCDIMPEMIERAKERDPNLPVEVRDVLVSPPPEQYDYVLISGLFNLRMNNEPQAWERFVEAMLTAAYAIARKGLASNFLTSHVEWRRQLGYYQDPASVLDFAMRKLSRFCELRHAYYPWEFALLVYRKPLELALGPPAVPWPPASAPDRPEDRAF